MRAIAVAAALLGLFSVGGAGQDSATAGTTTGAPKPDPTAYEQNTSTTIDAAPGTLKFDIVSVKPSASNSGRPAGIGPSYLVFVRGSTLYGTNVTLEKMIIYAYRVFPNESGKVRSFGGPEWTRSRRYDIVAKAAGPASLAEMRMMARNMLSERFRLAVHVEDRPTDIYILEVGKNGPKIAKSTEPPDGIRAVLHGGLGSKSTTMDALAVWLAIWYVGRPVLNQTGLTGRYKLRMEFAPFRADDWSAMSGGPAIESQTQRPGSDLPDVFDAIQRQLGLKLTARRVPLPTVILDHAEPPTEN